MGISNIFKSVPPTAPSLSQSVNTTNKRLNTNTKNLSDAHHDYWIAFK